MACACIKANGFDLRIDYVDSNTLVIEDFSNWVYSDVQDIPNTINITIRSLDRGVEKSLELKTNCKNRIKYSDLFNDNGKKIPDGFFCITTESCGISYTINRAFLHNSEIEVMKILSSNSDNLNSDTIDTLYECMLNIDLIKINSELGNFKTSSKIFKKLKRKLKNFKCDECDL